MDVPTIMDVFVSYGFETDDELTDARKLEALNEVYLDACSREPWPFLEVWATSDPLTSTGKVTVGGYSMATVTSVGDSTNRRVLQPVRLDDLQQQLWFTNPDRSAPDNPRVYYFRSGNMYVWPVPDPNSSLQLDVTFTQIPNDLTLTSVESDILIPKRYHRSLLVMGTLAKLALFQDDPDMAQQYDALYERQLARMVEDQFTQQTDRPDYIHVSDWDNYDYS